ncbi:MAG: LCP family protein [Mogibacterium sp.]|nr:LCP family protein [Mogibacterium sp.]
MDYKDWDPDELLDFDYGHKVPRDLKEPSQSQVGASDSSYDSYEELRKYQELRHHDEEQAVTEPASSRAMDPYEEYMQARNRDRSPERNKPVAVADDTGSILHKKEIGDSFKSVFGKKAGKDSSKRKEQVRKGSGQAAEKKRRKAAVQNEPVQAVAVKDEARRTPEENAALRQAQQEAYDRYRSTYNKNTRNTGRKKAGKFTRGLSWVYLLALAVFLAAITYMDVLPFGLLIAMYVVLGLLSLIIVIQLRKGNVKRWTRALASLTGIALIAFYGVGTAYAMGTLNFLDATSVDNPNSVKHITKEPFNICITGIDVKGTIDTEGRSDVNMILTINPSTAQVLMTSIPRDYQIYMPDKDNAMDKLTHTGFYSVATTIGAEEQLLDTSINYYVKVNFSTVEKFIDAIGGVDVYSEYEFNPVKMKKWTVHEGMNHMNGKQALAFARERKAFPTGDNQRIKNQQAVFEALFKKATSSKTMVLSYNTVISNLQEYFQMSFSSREMRALVKFQIAKNPDWNITKNALIGGDGSLPTYTTGGAYAYVMTQDEESIENAKALIQAVLEGKYLKKDKEGNVKILDDDDL